jgi:hypothetical protein
MVLQYQLMNPKRFRMPEPLPHTQKMCTQNT